MNTSTTFILLAFVVASVSLWPVSALPFPWKYIEDQGEPYKNELVSQTDRSIIKLIQNLEEPFISQESQIKMGQEALQYGTSSGLDEEQINEKTGAAKIPHMFGDLLLTPEQEEILIDGQSIVQGFLDVARPWSHGVVPYQLDHSLNTRARRAINEAINEFTRRSCIRFVQRTAADWRNYPNYVYFTPLRGCFSYLGMVGGRQVISIGRGCENKGIVQHEILHALGRIHEQSRPDRDHYVTIHLQNIRRGMERNFNVMQASTNGLPYDYGSIMHYGAYDFSSNRRPTITPKRQAVLGQRTALTNLDWRHLIQVYCQRRELETQFIHENTHGSDIAG